MAIKILKIGELNKMIKKYIKTTPVEAKRWLQKAMEDVE